MASITKQNSPQSSTATTADASGGATKELSSQTTSTVNHVVPVHTANGQPSEKFRQTVLQCDFHNDYLLANGIPLLFGGSDQPSTSITESGKTVVSLETFQKRFHACTGGVFQSFGASDWNNIVVAGGSVLHCLTPGTGNPSPNSDVDLFIYGLDDNQARKKISDLFTTLSQTSVVSTSGDTISVVKTIHTLTFVCPSSIPLLQIILRLHSDPHQVIQAFDVDCCGFYFDGFNVFATSQAADAINSHCNIAAPEKSSWTYSARLIKYVRRGYSIGVPSLRLDDLNLKISKQKIVRRHNLEKTHPMYLSYWVDDDKSKDYVVNKLAGEEIDLGTIVVFQDSEQETSNQLDYSKSKHLRKLLIADLAGRSIFGAREWHRTKFLNRVGDDYDMPGNGVWAGYPECMKTGHRFETTKEIAEKIACLYGPDVYGPPPPIVSCEEIIINEYFTRDSHYAKGYAANVEGPAAFLTGENSVTFKMGGIPTGTKEVGGTLDKWDEDCYHPHHDPKKRKSTSSLPDESSSASSAKKVKE